MENYLEKKKQVRDEIMDIIKDNNYLFSNLNLSKKDMEHVVEISISILMGKRYNYPYGSFVESVINNDLYSATIKADSVNIKALPFYAMLNKLYI